MRTPSGQWSTPGLRWRMRRVAPAVIAALVALPVTACDLAGASSAPEPPKRGGTLYVYTAAPLAVLDPQRNNGAIEANVLRLMARTLTTYKSAPGTAASEIVGDLATDIGRPSENNRVWEFTLKPNLKWEDGSPVTCTQVKYGIQRRFSELMDEGLPYPKKYLRDNSPPYLGPYLGGNNGDLGLESITCEDERNIRFELALPVGDFGYTVATNTFAAVHPDKDTKLEYAQRPFSNGPYKIKERTETELVLIRNNFWISSTDQVRPAYPDQIVFRYKPDEGGVVTNELIEDQGDARNTIMLDANVAPNFLQQVINDPELLKRTIIDPTGVVRYMAISTRNVPEKACREVLIQAFNKRKYRAVNGGSVTGDYATTMIPPLLRAHLAFDVFDSIGNLEGNLTRAQELLEQQKAAGKPCRTTVRVAFPDTPLRRRLMNTVVEAYQRIGLQVELHAIDPGEYFVTGVGDPANKYDLMLIGWVPDWANGSAVLPPLFDGDNIAKINPVTGHGSSNLNHALLNDSAINEQIDAALAETSVERQWALWGDLDRQIQERAVTIPLLYEKGIRLAGSNVRGGFIHPGFAMPDLCALGLARP